jgi:uncharacterized protein YnzC (UPF0291/DUF896 family)
MNNKDIDKEKLKKNYMKEYRIINKHKWAEKKVCSECGNEYTSSNISNHNKSKKHQFAVILKENEKLKKIKDIIIA